MIVWNIQGFSFYTFIICTISLFVFWLSILKTKIAIYPLKSEKKSKLISCMAGVFYAQFPSGQKLIIKLLVKLFAFSNTHEMA